MEEPHTSMATDGDSDSAAGIASAAAIDCHSPLSPWASEPEALQNDFICITFFAMAIMFLLLLTSIFFFIFHIFQPCNCKLRISVLVFPCLPRLGRSFRLHGQRYVRWSLQRDWRLNQKLLYRVKLSWIMHIQSYSIIFIIITIVFGIFIFFDWWKYNSNYVCSFSMLFNPAIRAKEASMLFSAHKVGSACTGALTSDMALSVIEKTVNDSKACRKIVFFDLQSVYEPLCFWYFSLRVFYFENYVANWCKLLICYVPLSRCICNLGVQQSLSGADQEKFLMVQAGLRAGNSRAVHVFKCISEILRKCHEYIRFSFLFSICLLLGGICGHLILFGLYFQIWVLFSLFITF